MTKQIVENDFSKFGKTFQEKLVRIMFEDKTYCRQIAEVVDIEFFELKYLKVFLSRIFDYYKKYEIYPNLSTMATMIKVELDGEDATTKKQVKEFFLTIAQAEEPLEDEEYVKETALEFCKKRKLQEALLRSAQLLNKGKYEEIKKMIESALKLGSDNNFGHDYKLDFEERYKTTTRNPISTGFAEIDDITGGGSGKGELGVIVSGTGLGKSFTLVHIGAAALKKKKNIVYYTLELLDSTIAKRFDSCITKIPLDDLLEMKDDVFDGIKDLQGKLIVKSYPAKKATVDTLRNHVSKLQNAGFIPDMIIVDYADLLKPGIARDEKHTEREDIYEDLRSMAQELEVPIWTASQTNRGGYNSELVTLDSIADAFAKCFVSDLIITLSRTLDEKKINRGKLFVAKNRNGLDGIVFKMRVDLATASFEILQDEPEQADSSKSMKEKLKQLYDKMREEKERENKE